MKKYLLVFLGYSMSNPMIMPPTHEILECQHTKQSIAWSSLPEIYKHLESLGTTNERDGAYALQDFVKSLYNEKYIIDSNAPSYPILNRLRLLDTTSRVKKPLRGALEILLREQIFEPALRAKL
jgi:hypothetical protein